MCMFGVLQKSETRGRERKKSEILGGPAQGVSGGSKTNTQHPNPNPTQQQQQQQQWIGQNWIGGEQRGCCAVPTWDIHHERSGAAIFLTPDGVKRGTRISIMLEIDRWDHVLEFLRS